MRLIIAGSRSLTSYALLCECMQQTQFGVELHTDACTIISGCARGIDRLAIRWAHEHGLFIERYEAEWKKYGKSAGFMRNASMLDRADGLLAIWEGYSFGTKQMVHICLHKGIPTEIFDVHRDGSVNVRRFNF